MIVAEIHQVVIEVYGENIMSEGMVRKWVRASKNGRTNVHDEERSGRPSVITEDLAHKADGKLRENRRFMISSSSDYHFFLHLKKHLGGQRHEGDDDLKMAVLANFYEDGIQKLVVRYDKCLNFGGNYIEK
ncbi:hypothetical protein AVEN_15320-1 [Araneus ventricosus]|uniref:Mos1 transposase HTH domain-containing protein n=1 Tax=Araneus ventricosus TaxID=182803 RepID=A0A4Y2JHZ5_ARAVE|nr:hypothetical protein AVEN_15320-1 [Araneus ventricosus]